MDKKTIFEIIDVKYGSKSSTGNVVRLICLYKLRIPAGEEFNRYELEDYLLLAKY